MEEAQIREFMEMMEIHADEERKQKIRNFNILNQKAIPGAVLFRLLPDGTISNL